MNRSGTVRAVVAGALVLVAGWALAQEGRTPDKPTTEQAPPAPVPPPSPTADVAPITQVPPSALVPAQTALRPRCLPARVGTVKEYEKLLGELYDEGRRNLQVIGTGVVCGW